MSAAISGAPVGPKAGPAIVAAGLIAGTLDITAAFITWGLKGLAPILILQSIASGALGPGSFQGGWTTGALGLLLHFFIAFSAATVFYLASRRMAFLTLHPLISGILYGVAVYLVMYWVVVPLSLTRKFPFDWQVTIVAVLTHMICVGLPISLAVRKFAPAGT